MYTLSRDYARLFDLLCTGQVLVGWVRYSESLRDVVKIERRAEFDIYIGVRGICYTDLGTFDREKGEERDVFAARCESVDLEWIEPSVPRAEVAALRAQLHTEIEQRQFVGDLIENMPHAQIAAELGEFKIKVADALTTMEHALRPDLFRPGFYEAAMEIIGVTREQLGIAPGKDEASDKPMPDCPKCGNNSEVRRGATKSPTC